MSASTQLTWQDFGPFLRRLRESQGISQEQLAYHLGCHRIHIYRLEHGRRHPSRILLRSLRRECALLLSNADSERLHLFELLVEYRCSALDVNGALAHLPIRL